MKAAALVIGVWFVVSFPVGWAAGTWIKRNAHPRRTAMSVSTQPAWDTTVMWDLSHGPDFGKCKHPVLVMFGDRIQCDQCPTLWAVRSGTVGTDDPWAVTQ